MTRLRLELAILLRCSPRELAALTDAEFATLIDVLAEAKR